jgi:hypothetical protein
MLGFGSVGEFEVGGFDEDTDSNVSAPVVDLALDAPLPGVSAGVNIQCPGLTIAFSVPVVAVAAGVNIQAPAAVLAFGPELPTPLTGLNLGAPTLALAFTAPAPSVSAGVNIQLPQAPFTIIEDSEGSVGEFAVGEADYSVQGHIVFVPHIPVVKAGVSISSDLLTISFSAPIPEPVARTRATRVRMLNS